MNGSTQNVQIPTILFICLVFFSACTSLSHRISKESKEVLSPSETNAIISVLKSQNQNLKTIKGVGRITFLESEEKEMSTRIAWVASTPDKIRITLSSISGHPMISAASDGQWFYFVSHARGDYYKKRPTNFNMKRFFSISIKSEDMVDSLFGRIPVVKYDSINFVEDRSLTGRSGKEFENANGSLLIEDINKGNKDSCILHLKDRWGNVREKIYLNDRLDAHKIEMFDVSGALVYRLEFIRMQEVKSYRVPHRLRVSNDKGEGFQLDLDRYWTDAVISPSVFTLTPPS